MQPQITEQICYENLNEGQNLKTYQHQTSDNRSRVNRHIVFSAYN